MRYLKSILGAASAGISALGTALLDNNVTPLEWVGVAGAIVATFTTVAYATNQKTADDVAHDFHRLSDSDQVDLINRYYEGH